MVDSDPVFSVYLIIITVNNSAVTYTPCMSHDFHLRLQGCRQHERHQYILKRSVVVFSVMIEDKKPVKVEKTEVIDERDRVRCGYVRKTRSRAWTSKGQLQLRLLFDNWADVTHIVQNVQSVTYLSSRLWSVICVFHEPQLRPVYMINMQMQICIYCIYLLSISKLHLFTFT